MNKKITLWVELTIVFIAAGFIFFSLSPIYVWARIAFLIYIFCGFLALIFANTYLQMRYGGFGPISWPLMLLIRSIQKEKPDPLPEQEHPLKATFIYMAVWAALLLLLIIALVKK